MTGAARSGWAATTMDAPPAAPSWRRTTHVQARARGRRLRRPGPRVCWTSRLRRSDAPLRPLRPGPAQRDPRAGAARRPGRGPARPYQLAWRRPLALRRSLPHCARVVAETIAESPKHRLGGGPPIERAEWEAMRAAGR